MTAVEGARTRSGGNNRNLNSQSSLNAYVKSICDIMRRSKLSNTCQS